MISYSKATEDDLELLMQSRLEMLRAVNDLPEDYVFTDELMACSREYFKNANQTTILAIDEKVVGCATMCYIDMMPTFSHPTGKRAHLMNVFTNSQYRRQGIAFQMLGILINEAKEKGVTEISLDATELGRDLYKKHGFVESNECMVLIVNGTNC
ncbi:acetyltransferase (GNAT) family protein [Ruminiclostridium hungatei]|uniref:Acetyltransferase (GNAT) family protein n=1 Tax=Ruminiclostridium hungatei TaxID=48256 RepID=A0A1V4SEI4_RUMHU|nr:GNAT family N-acetyltransferase [Ruminiclostridium hungatei]OPX42322.1 acetyltransferase (GNAT) family protein [Ruminiclostridium hungatei]